MTLEQAISYNDLRQCHLNERRIKFITDTIDHYSLTPGSTILEIGSGTGWLLLRLARIYPQLKFIGVEINEGFVSFARQQNPPTNLIFIRGSAEEIDQMPVEKIDLILSNDVLHHVNATIESIIKHLSAKASKKGCQWLIIEPNCLNLYVFWCHKYRWRKDGEDLFHPWEFANISSKHGWVLNQCGFLFLFPSRFKKITYWQMIAEKMLEWVPLIGGGIYLKLSSPPWPYSYKQ